MQGIQKRFPKDGTLPAGLDCKSFTVREVTNRDELEASSLAQEAAPASIAVNPIAMINYEARELVRLSIVAVDDVPVTQPYFDINDWSVRTWKYLQTAYQEVNGVDHDELKKFKGRLVGGPASASDPETYSATVAAS